MGSVVNATPRPIYPGKEPVLIVQEAGLAPGPVWTGAESVAPHRDSIPGPSIPLRVAILTELPGLQRTNMKTAYTGQSA